MNRGGSRTVIGTSARFVHWRSARRGAWTVFVAAGALWVVVLFKVTPPNVIGAWSIVLDPDEPTHVMLEQD